MIICGFPGTGKSMMAKFSQWVDLESTPFKKNWLLYAEVAKHMSDNGYTVMVSTHEGMLDALEQIEANYIVVIPPITDKATYLNRYNKRGNTYDFIRLLDENWEKWINTIVEKPSVLKTIVVLPKDGCIKAFADEFRKENRRDLIDRQAAIDALKRDEEYDEDIPNRADGVRDAIITISGLPSAQPEPWEDERKKIADALSEKMAYMNTCLNERDIILGYLGVKRPNETHCNSDCRNEKCESYHYATKELPSVESELNTRLYTDGFDDGYAQCEKDKAQWVPKKGKWIKLDFSEAWEYKCDQCGRLSDFEENYCPSCGADMRGET